MAFRGGEDRRGAETSVLVLPGPVQNAGIKTRGCKKRGSGARRAKALSEQAGQ